MRRVLIVVVLMLVAMAAQGQEAVTYGVGNGAINLVQHKVDYARRLLDIHKLAASIEALADAIELLDKNQREALVPLAYTNEVKTLRYEKTVRRLFAPGSTNLVIGWVTDATNWPSAVIHTVTYGRGTNPLFKMRTCEVLPEPDPAVWRNAEWRWYNPATKILGLKENHEDKD